MSQFMKPGFKKHYRNNKFHHRHKNNGHNGGHNNGGQRSFANGQIDTRQLKKAQVNRDKYLQLAQDALGGGDRVLAENYFQHADHYNRVVMEIQEQLNQFEATQQQNNLQHDQSHQPEQNNVQQPAHEHQPAQQQPQSQQTAYADASDFEDMVSNRDSEILLSEAANDAADERVKEEAIASVA